MHASSPNTQEHLVTCLAIDAVSSPSSGWIRTQASASFAGPRTPPGLTADSRRVQLENHLNGDVVIHGCTIMPLAVHGWPYDRRDTPAPTSTTQLMFTCLSGARCPTQRGACFRRCKRPLMSQTITGDCASVAGRRDSSMPVVLRSASSPPPGRASAGAPHPVVCGDTREVQFGWTRLPSRSGCAAPGSPRPESLPLSCLSMSAHGVAYCFHKHSSTSPAANVRPPSRSTTRPSAATSAAASMASGRVRATSTTARWPASKNRAGRGPVGPSICSRRSVPPSRAV